MRRPTFARAAAAAALLVAVAGGCGDPGTDAGPSDGPSSPDASTTAPADPSSSTTAAGASGSGSPAGGTAAQPAVLTPSKQLLRWERVEGPVGDDVTRGGGWTLTVRDNGRSYQLAGPHSAEASGEPGRRVSDALLDGDWAVVVLQDRTEQRPARAQVTELGTGRSFTIDGRSDVPTTTGGTWALGEGHLLHATVAHGSYCLARVDLESRKSTVEWCAPRRTGFNGARITPAGDSMQTFDHSRPSCRSVVAIGDHGVTPFPEVEECHGYDGLVLDDGAVWSVVSNEHRVETAEFYARTGDDYFDLGPGLSGSLTWCGGAAYFVRDPQRDGAPATLMRWAPGDGLSIAYESPGGQAFLSVPRCGGDQLTLTSMAGAGDEQVAAPVG